MCPTSRRCSNFEPPASEMKIHAPRCSSWQASGFNKPSQANAEACRRRAGSRAVPRAALLTSLHTQAPGRDGRDRGREGKERSRLRFG